MTESKETSGTQATPSQSRETVGEILRKERVTRRITVETIAKELKLNAGYIKALEANSYEQLPADPYVRVYLRSIASYLMLDPEQILQKFYDDRGLKPSLHKDERATKLVITMREPKKNQMPWTIAVVIVAVLAAFGYIANKAGWISSSSTPTPAQTPATHVAADSIVDSIQSVPPDSVLPMTTDSGMQQQTVPADTQKLKTTATPDSIRLQVTVLRDSVWVQAFNDGVPWRNYINKRAPRMFVAKDSINVHVGNNDILKYSLNGSPLTIADRGIVYLKLNRNGLERWDQTKWTKVFKDRLK